ncbi:thiamine-phosphate kinase [Methanobacterium petrolearium]|uniref:thiamine-phosphate kinase n=1 Tax=Methanobacterium petrolearium TaxID=710190 RepID=UPI001AE8AEFF|nr:thiamine-phosphate kinase [Methanobacterium petrolearium]MBP1944734.1 thiamine-monophosphate kinase [Methanobacterium petrolearium]BDZ70000.1 thiamine-monophosphate kinase [Methanobacterium petrolearium]
MPSKNFKNQENLKISHLGEKKLIKRLLSRSRALQPDSPFFDEFYFKSLSDDAALLNIDDNYLVVTSDLLIESTHFPSKMSAYQKGMKVVTVNVSDLAAMGAKPIGFILSLGLPRELSLNEFDATMEGVLQACKEYGMGLMGGDTNQSDELILSGTCLGMVDKEKVLLKEGAHKGDIVAVTGPLGVAAAGFEFLLYPPSNDGSKSNDHGEKFAERFKPTTLELIEKHALQPHARLKEGILLADSGAVTSATDITDGLASEVGELVAASSGRVGITLFQDMIPIIPEVKEVAAALNKNPLDLALYYGEDFELLLTVQKDEFEQLKDEFDLIPVGVVTDSGQMEIVDKAGKTKILEPKGYQHFK